MHSYWKFIKENGVYLKDKTGTLDWALSRGDALRALDILQKIGLSVLGGDVVLEKDNKFYYIFEDQVQGSWSVDRLDDESFGHYLERSILESREYIEKHPEGNSGKYYYVLTPGGMKPEVAKKERQELSDMLKKWPSPETNEGNYEWLVDLILIQLRNGVNFEDLRDYINEEITKHFNMPVIVNMDVNSNTKQIFEWYEKGEH